MKRIDVLLDSLSDYRRIVNGLDLYLQLGVVPMYYPDIPWSKSVWQPDFENMDFESDEAVWTVGPIQAHFYTMIESVKLQLDNLIAEGKENQTYDEYLKEVYNEVREALHADEDDYWNGGTSSSWDDFDDYDDDLGI